MQNALLLVQFLQAAVTAGVEMLPLLEKVSNLIQAHRTAGTEFTKDELTKLFDEGDAYEAGARELFEKALADPNLPPA